MLNYTKIRPLLNRVLVKFFFFFCSKSRSKWAEWLKGVHVSGAALEKKPHEQKINQKQAINSAKKRNILSLFTS